MAEYGNPNDRMKEITDRLEEGKQFYSHHENNLLGSCVGFITGDHVLLL
jgi:hypothetical protein